MRWGIQQAEIAFVVSIRRNALRLLAPYQVVVGRNNHRALRRMLIPISDPAFITARPIWRVHPLLNKPVKSRIRPITHVSDQAVFQRIDMNIIQMRPKVRLVAYQMLPLTALPNTSFATPDAYRESMFIEWQALGKAGLDQAPPRGKISVVWRQLDHTVEVLGQHDPCVNDEGMPLSY